MSILIDMQEELTEKFESYQGARGMPDEVSEAIDQIKESTELLREFEIEIPSDMSNTTLSKQE